jgi:hypothetical protein
MYLLIQIYIAVPNSSKKTTGREVKSKLITGRTLCPGKYRCIKPLFLARKEDDRSS